MILETEIMHGSDWSGQDLTGWVVMEKFDGIRAEWDGRQLWTRSGNIIDAPAWLTAGLPNERLSCELWAGRGGFGTVTRAIRWGKWSDKITLVIFDAQDRDGNLIERLAGIKEGAHFAPVGIEFAQSTDHVLRLMGTVQKLGGEGLMVCDPAAHYEAGRVETLLKVKSAKPARPSERFEYCF